MKSYIRINGDMYKLYDLCDGSLDTAKQREWNGFEIYSAEALLCEIEMLCETEDLVIELQKFETSEEEDL